MTLSAKSTKANCLPLPAVIILSILVVGTLDLTAAYIDFYIASGKNPFTIVPKYISSAVLGMKAFSGDTGTIILGMGLHYIIAAIFTIFFFLIYPRLGELKSRRFLLGILYGIFMWSIMRFIVVPASNAPLQPPIEWDKALRAISILIVMIGLPLSFIAYAYYKSIRTKDSTR